MRGAIAAFEGNNLAPLFQGVGRRLQLDRIEIERIGGRAKLSAAFAWIGGEGPCPVCPSWQSRAGIGMARRHRSGNDWRLRRGSGPGAVQSCGARRRQARLSGHRGQERRCTQRFVVQGVKAREARSLDRCAIRGRHLGQRQDRGTRDDKIGCRLTGRGHSGACLGTWSCIVGQVGPVGRSCPCVGDVLVFSRLPAGTHGLPVRRRSGSAHRRFRAHRRHAGSGRSRRSGRDGSGPRGRTDSGRRTNRG